MIFRACSLKQKRERKRVEYGKKKRRGLGRECVILMTEAKEKCEQQIIAPPPSLNPRSLADNPIQTIQRVVCLGLSWV